MIPEINKTYSYFDDGKIRYSRMDKVLITEVIPFDKIDKETLSIWQKESIRCDWLYRGNTDFFIKGHLKEENHETIFVRDIDNNWFSMGWFGGTLDVDNSLTESLGLNRSNK